MSKSERQGARNFQACSLKQIRVNDAIYSGSRAELICPTQPADERGRAQFAGGTRRPAEIEQSVREVGILAGKLICGGCRFVGMSREQADAMLTTENKQRELLLESLTALALAEEKYNRTLAEIQSRIDQAVSPPADMPPAAPSAD